ncbi:CCAP receptor [Elysia marginata]|uniref:CCAP receptor n=1 Tax=Elysia marginata TaxID=1093978 RepID=A0AAV4IF49_9GAST|nr:CCAP receptor [Elysia marginata]
MFRHSALVYYFSTYVTYCGLPALWSSDLSAGLINVLTDIVWKNTISWYAGNGGCKVIRYAQVVVTYASTYALVALSLDRLNAIARPLSFSGDRTRIRLLIGLAWGFSFLFALPMIFINNLEQIDGRWQCWIQFPGKWAWKLYITLIAVALFFIPAIIITVCYSIIVIIIWTKTSGGSTARDTSTQHVKNGE